MEKWDIYDRNGNLTGKTKTRNESMELGEYHLGASLWLFNHNGELLIQKRAASKRIKPNVWSVAGGSVISGETSVQACIRETKEEIGIQVNEDELVLFQRSFGENNIFDDYVAIQEVPIETIIIQPEEVSEVKWASIEEIKRLSSLGLFMIDIKGVEKVIQYVDENISI